MNNFSRNNIIVALAQDKVRIMSGPMRRIDNEELFWLLGLVTGLFASTFAWLVVLY